MKKIFILASITFLFNLSYSQDIKYAKQIIEKLCSEEFHGRDYADDADGKVAEYIVSELKNNNVEKFKKSYTQKFHLSANSINGKNIFKSGENNLKPGVDFITHAGSKSIKGKFDVLKITPEYYRAKQTEAFIKIRQTLKTNNVILIDSAGKRNKDFEDLYKELTREDLPGKATIINVKEGNLSYAPSGRQYTNTQIQISRESSKLIGNSVYLDIESEFNPKYETQNIAGFIEGKIDSFIVFSAHYDHIGQNGDDVYFPGANDNASGIAMVLNLAKYFSEHKPEYSIAFLFFSGEELGLKGSKFYTENPLFPLSKIKFLVNLDMVGSGDEGIKIVNGSVFKKEFDIISDINKKKKYLPDVKIRGAAANSDHYFFYANGVKSFFIYTLGKYKEYHNINDKPKNLPLNEFDDLKKLLIDFVESF